MRFKKLLAFIGTMAALQAGAQELYPFAEPASNMPAYSVSPRLKAMYSTRGEDPFFQRYLPEMMFGINRNLMVHGGAAIGNMHSNNLRWEGAYIYSKYRFLSIDEVHRHFRMAAFAEAGYSRNPAVYDDLSLRGDNSGVSGGLIATQLVNRFAVSATVGYLRHLYKQPEHLHHEPAHSAINYSLSTGYLVLPVEYKSYDQLNLNLYAELIGQRTYGWKSWYVDLAPAVQLIFKSNARLNLGYRFQLNGEGNRGMRNSCTVSFEYLFFNALKKGKK